MISYDEIKVLPKIDLHINFVSSISTTLAYSLDDSLTISDVIDMTTIKHINEYDHCLEIPIKLLNNEKNIRLAVIDLINNLKSNNVIYGELYLDLPLYKENINVEKIVLLILDIIKKEQINLKIVLCVSDKLSKDSNLTILNVLEKYYNCGVSGVYFKKDKLTDISNYVYIFDRLIRQNIPYTLTFDGKLTNQNRDIYQKADKIEYLFPELDSELIEIVKNNNIMLLISISKMLELNLQFDIYAFITNLIKNNINININSSDMMILNTNIINEYCLLFGNSELSLLEIVKLLINNINSLSLSKEEREKILLFLKEESNKLL